jgi:hypothetical protein
MRLFAWAFLALLFAACSTVPTASVSPAQPKYELMLSGTIDGAPFTGIGVGSSAPQHAMTIQSSIPVNYFTMDSCHRSIQFNGVIPGTPWFEFWKNGKTQSFAFTYDEALTIEDSGDCLLRFCAFSSVVGAPAVACAVTDFKSPKYQLPGTNICNGANGNTTGTALCHSKVGLIERYQFAASVFVAPEVVDPTGNTAPYWITNQCVGKFLDDAQTLFEYQVPSSECYVVFMEKAKPHRRAKLSVIPFDTAQFPGSL